jgi:hypothetical protein
MSDTKQILEEMMPRIHEAETALHNGDAGPRFEMWSHMLFLLILGRRNRGVIMGAHPRCR